MKVQNLSNYKQINRAMAIHSLKWTKPYEKLKEGSTYMITNRRKEMYDLVIQGSLISYKCNYEREIKKTKNFNFCF